MKTEEVKTVRVNQEKRKVFFHMNDGRTVVRTFDARDIIQANRIGHLEGEQRRTSELVRLFNEKYAEPQSTAFVQLSTSERRFFELHNMSKIVPLDADQEEEYNRLLNE